MRVVVATRSPHKLRELQQLFETVDGLELLTLEDAGVEPEPAEEAIEVFETFRDNALAKARYFAERTPHPVLADDSGIEVDALGGAPGVRSKRFSGRTELTGQPLDDANNDYLLTLLRELPDERRGARYVCVLALVAPGGDEEVFVGGVEGRILRDPVGTGGFGYDPLFFVPEIDATFAQVPAEVKQRFSHRARAAAAALPALRRLVEG